jgi:anti-sigma regulatory factor (Ser/Thr protein kinase)
MSHQTEIKVVSLTNRLNDLGKIAGALEDIADLWSLPVDLTMTLNLVIEEAFTNVVNYAFQDESFHDIDLVIQKIDNRLVISLKDDGVA